MPVILASPVPGPPPVIPPVTEGADQVYVVFAGTRPLVTSTGVSVNVPPLQIVVLMLVTAGIGLTVTVIVNVAPVQLPETGVTVYVAVPDTLSAFTSVPVMVAPEPDVPPVIDPLTEGIPQL